MVLTQDTELSEKRGETPSAGKSFTIGARIPPDVLAALDAYRLAKSPAINRSAALRQLATDALRLKGLLGK